MLLAISIVFSVMIMMTALFIQRPLEFSAFPTVLLIATMLRLGLSLVSLARITARGYHRHLLPVARVAADWRVDNRLRRLQVSVHQSQINLHHLPLFELLLQLPKPPVVLGGDD